MQSNERKCPYHLEATSPKSLFLLSETQTQHAPFPWLILLNFKIMSNSSPSQSDARNQAPKHQPSMPKPKDKEEIPSFARPTISSAAKERKIPIKKNPPPASRYLLVNQPSQRR